MRSFVTEYYRLDLSGFPYPDEIPERIAVVADLHNAVYGRKNSELLHTLRDVKPDMILIPGDLVTADRRENVVAFSFLKEISRLGVPVLYSPGNHEEKFRMRAPERYQEFLTLLKRLGIRYLDNEWYAFSEHVSFCGLRIPYGCYRKGFRMRKLTVKDIQEVLGKPPEGIRFGLCHNPVWFPVYAKYGLDVVVAGHLHGGIVRLPGIGGLISPQWRLFPKYDAGMFRFGRKSMYVSRGLGMHTVQLRFLNKAELMVIER